MSSLRSIFRLTYVVALLAGAASLMADEEPAVAGPFTRDELMASLTRDLAAHFNFEGDLQLELIRPWTPPARVASRWELNILEYPSVPSAALMVRCRVLADATPVAETTFVLRAQLWRDAWVSRLPLANGAPFDPASLETRRVDLLRDRDALPAAVGDRTYIFTRAVQAGRLLTWRDIARRPLVRKGDVVEVSATDGRLVVTMKALAMENGARGDTITVRNPESRKDIAALVTDENRVQVRF
ncbi:MAG TPA: flagellar basal body P-ring formation chaperone FlgA [Gemmatimonadaceae bacterium]